MLEHLFQQTIGLEKSIGKNEYGKVSYGALSTIYVRYEYTDELVRLPNGDEVRSKFSIFTDVPINIGDRLEIEEGKYIVLKVTPTFDPNNPGEVLFREVYT